MHLQAILITTFSLFLALPSSAMASPERGAQKLQSAVNQSTTAWSPVKASKRAMNSWITSLKRNDCKGISRVTAGKCMDRKCYTSCQTGKCRGIARGDYTSCSGDGVCKGVARVIDTLGECYDAYDRKKRKQGNKFDRRAEDRKLRQCDAKARADAELLGTQYSPMSRMGHWRLKLLQVGRPRLQGRRKRIRATVRARTARRLPAATVVIVARLSGDVFLLSGTGRIL